MEVNTQRRATGLRDKIPDIQKTLDVVKFLKSRQVCYLNMAYRASGGPWYTILED
jgi:hypothetical protein